MATANTLREAIFECFLAQPGAELSNSQVDRWIQSKYYRRWKDISTALADLTIDGNTSSPYRPSEKILVRARRGVYKLAEGYGIGGNHDTAAAQHQRAGLGQPMVGKTPLTNAPSRKAEGPEQFWIPGIPSVWASAAERPWLRCLAEQILPAGPNDQEYRGIHLRLSLEADTRAGQRFDLDNLCEPVFRVLINKRGYFGGKRPNVRWWSAFKKVESPSGCHIQLANTHDTDACPGRLLFEGVYRGEFPLGARDTRIAEWVEATKSNTLRVSAAPFAVSIEFGSDCVNIAEIATQPTKPIIDNLFPVIGGKVSAPDDWRIQRLFVSKGHDDLSDDQVRVVIAALDTMED